MAIGNSERIRTSSIRKLVSNEPPFLKGVPNDKFYNKVPNIRLEIDPRVFADQIILTNEQLRYLSKKCINPIIMKWLLALNKLKSPVNEINILKITKEYYPYFTDEQILQAATILMTNDLFRKSDESLEGEVVES